MKPLMNLTSGMVSATPGSLRYAGAGLCAEALMRGPPVLAPACPGRHLSRGLLWAGGCAVGNSVGAAVTCQLALPGRCRHAHVRRCPAPGTEPAIPS